MFQTIFRNEISHWLRQPYVYLFAGLLFVISLATMWGMAAEATGGPDAEMLNSHFRINFMSNYLSLLMLFVLPATLGAAVYRDFKSEMYTLLYAYPITKPAYLAAKFLAAYLVTAAVVLTIGFGFVLGTQMPGVNQEVLLPFALGAYTQLYAVYILPNMLLFGVLVFAIVTLTRNVYAGFVTIILVIVFQGLLGGLLNGEDLGYWAALLDPVGDTAVRYSVRFWTTAARNEDALPVSGVILHNRLLWMSIAIIIGGYVYRRFNFQQFSENKQGKKIEVAAPRREISFSPAQMPTVAYHFSTWQRMTTVWQIGKADFRYIVLSWPFLVMLVAGFLLVYFQQHQMNPMYGFEILPTTGRMLQVPMFIFSLVINLLTFLYVGVLQFRGQTTRMGPLVDTVPQPDWVLMLSRLLAVLLMQLLLLGLVMVAGLLAQTLQGYYRYELWHYVFELLGLQFIHFVIWACVAMLVQTLVKNMYLGFFLLLLMPTAVAGLRVIGDYLKWPFLRESIIQFNQVPGVTIGFSYSDLTGYGTILPLYYAFKSYWLVLGIVFLLLSLLWWRRGKVYTWRERWQVVQQRFNGGLRTPIILSGALFLLMGGYLYFEENVWATAQYTKAKEQRILALNEKRYMRFQDYPQPMIAGANIKMDIYPKKRDFTASGQLYFVNKLEQTIDTILVASSFREITEYEIQQPHQLISEDKEVRFDVWALDWPLAKGDTLVIAFTVRNYPNTLLHDNSRVIKNGTYITANILPTLGFRNAFLSGEEKRANYGLPPREARPLLPSDTTLLGYTFTGNNMDRIVYETVVSTSADQQAFSMGNLVRSWTDGDRRYAHYRSDGLITNNISWLSGRYTRKTASAAGMGLAIYHDPAHDRNYESLVEGIQSSLDYCSRWFGPLDYDTLRLIEFPLTQGTHATLNGNLIPYSEALFLCKVDPTEEEPLDIPFYSSAHEVAHYWWAHRVDPANVDGGKLVTEALAEYIAMQVMKQELGEKRLNSFRKTMHDVYLRSRAQSGDEVPLILAKEGQDYLNYYKGGLAFYALSAYWSEEALNSSLASYEAARRYAPPPYPTSLELIAHLQKDIPDSLQYLLEDYFETITLYDNQLQNVELRSNTNHKWEVNLSCQVTKYRANKSGQRRFTNAAGDYLQTEDIQSLPLRDYIEIGFYKNTDAGEVLISKRKIKVTAIQNDLQFTLTERPDRIVLDPDLLLFEEDREDNGWER
jgi:ABC-2 type transport system permease protein